MYLIGQSNKFLEQANVKIEITSTVTNSQNGYEQLGFESYDHGSLALKDQFRASVDLGSQCQEGQSYDLGAGQQQDGSNHLTDLGDGKLTVEQSNITSLKEIYKEYSNRRQADSLYPSLVTDWIQSINLKRDQGQLDTSRVPRDIENEQIEVHLNKIRGQFESFGLIIDQELQEQIVEKVAFKDLAWVKPCFAIPKSDSGKWRKITDCSILNRFLRTNHFIMEDINTEQVLSLQCNVLWGETCNINISQEVETSYEVNQKEVGSERRILLRQSDLSMSRQRKSGVQKVEYPADSLRIRLEDLGKQILPLTNVRNRIPRMAYQLKTQSDNDVKPQKIEDVKSVWKMEKKNSAKDFSQSQISSKFHRSFEFPEAINLQNGPPHEKAQQDEAKSSDYKRMKQQDVSVQDNIVGSFLVKEQDRVEQTDQSHSVATISHPTNGRISGLMGCNTQHQQQQVRDMVLGDCNNHWRLTSSNQRETAAVLCGLLRSAPFLREQQVQSLKFETESSSTAYNLSRGAAATSPLKLNDRKLEVAEDLDLLIHALHIHGKENMIPDSLSRLGTSGDYSLKEDILQKVPYLHPPIPLIQQTLNKLMKEKEQAWMILPNWPSQPWWPVLMKMTSRLIILGENADVSVPGGKMKKQKKHLPPGRMMAVILEVSKEKNNSDGFLIKEALQALPHKTSQTVGMKLEEDIVKDQGNMMNTGSGFKKEKINGVALQQIMKKPQAGMWKLIKEERVWNYDQLLRYIKGKSDQKMKLSEMEFLGIVIATINGYSTQSMFKRHDTSVTVIFRPLEDLSICPTQWLSFWMSRRKKKDEKLPVWWLHSMNRAASYEQTSKAVHIIIKACKIPQVAQSPRSDLPQ
ncbi:MAG: hypothetical protein EZS28_000825 [Streblomastix strix]|uniref:Uncharacterized protein n=1 Tax=Streblomastix strix TaxID=222440 RepID=A0A5J4X919_9EUKA|nr:MAG: hypothetical protein EZS28_000825 [Streblomastix strix]